MRQYAQIQPIVGRRFGTDSNEIVYYLKLQSFGKTFFPSPMQHYDVTQTIDDRPMTENAAQNAFRRKFPILIISITF